jgi:hypothetical protein
MSVRRVIGKAIGLDPSEPLKAAVKAAQEVVRAESFTLGFRSSRGVRHTKESLTRRATVAALDAFSNGLRARSGPHADQVGDSSRLDPQALWEGLTAKNADGCPVTRRETLHHLATRFVPALLDRVVADRLKRVNVESIEEAGRVKSAGSSDLESPIQSTLETAKKRIPTAEESQPNHMRASMPPPVPPKLPLTPPETQLWVGPGASLHGPPGAFASGSGQRSNRSDSRAGTPISSDQLFTQHTPLDAGPWATPTAEELFAAQHLANPLSAGSAVHTAPWPSPQSFQSVGSSLRSSYSTTQSKISTSLSAASSATSVFTGGSQVLPENPDGSGKLSSVRLDQDTALLYQQLNLEITSETLPAYLDKHLISSPTTLGSGKFNTTYSVTLESPGRAPYSAVFKPLKTTEYGVFSGQSGIDMEDPQIAMRNLSTQAFAQKLQWDVVPKTEMAVLTVPRGEPPEPILSAGLLMERARGVPSVDLPQETLSHPAVVRELTKVQLLDNLVMQGDRHGNNMFVDIQSDDNGSRRVKVTAIDNDQCLGEKGRHPEFKLKEHGSRNWTIKMPAVVDHEMAKAVMSLGDEDIDAMMGHRQTAAEVDAAKARLQVVKEHIQRLGEEGAVIASNDEAWNSEYVRQRLNKHNSYAMRDIQEQLNPTKW